MSVEDYNRLLETYRTTKETAGKVTQIFSQGNLTLSDPEYETIVAGFMQNRAIAVSYTHLTLPTTPYV